MHPTRIYALLGLLLMLAAQTAFAQSKPVRIRGTITGLDGNLLSVKSRDGKDLKITLADNATVAAAKAITLADIKQGDFVGSATRVKPDGSLVAIEVHLFPAALRGVVSEGHIPWDLEPGSMMTNATMTSLVQGTSGREITLQYKTGSQKILVPEGVPIFTTVPADRSLLVPGAFIFTGAMASPDGKITASRIQVSKDVAKPAQ